MRERPLLLMSNFRVAPLSSENTYRVASIFPQVNNPIRTIRQQFDREKRKQPNVSVRREAMTDMLSSFLTDTSQMGLELGQHDPAVRLLRVGGVGVGESRENPLLQPGWSRIRINDKSGNDVQFRMTYEKQYMDGEDREWDKVVIRLEKARINGERVHLTPEMKREGFEFLSHGMQEILEKAQDGQPVHATIRQETPDASCFVDGHHASAGKHELGCMCKEERAASLVLIHERGGINSLVPGTGNGNGSEAQDIQISVRNHAARRGLKTTPFQDIYSRMGLKGDSRNNTISISTFILEHLFQMQHVPNLTVLTESKAKKETWNTFGSHIVTGESLNITPTDIPDSLFKRRRLGYTHADTSPFPLQRQ